MEDNADKAFKRWVADVRSDRKNLYRFNKRKDHLSHLMGYFKEYNVGMDDASFFKNKAVDILVHEEGQKNQGNYKNWKKTAQEDFDDYIQLTYVEGIDHKQFSTTLDYKPDPDIVAWAKSKFGNDVGPKILKDCHYSGHVLNLMFIDEFYERRRK